MFNYMNIYLYFFHAFIFLNLAEDPFENGWKFRSRFPSVKSSEVSGDELWHLQVEERALKGEQQRMCLGPCRHSDGWRAKPVILSLGLPDISQELTMYISLLSGNTLQRSDHTAASSCLLLHLLKAVWKRPESGSCTAQIQDMIFFFFNKSVILVWDVQLCQKYVFNY